MRQPFVVSLANVLFKSYFRASRPGKRSPFSNPFVILLLDAVLFAAPFALVSYVLPMVPTELASFLQPLTVQAVVGIPVILTSAVILAGILFELGQGSGLASSEAVNWLPVSPREYVTASAVSVNFAYSPFLFFAFGAIIPLALSFDMASILPSAILLSLLAFFWGAIIVEVLRAVTNRVSISVYRKSGRLGVILRIALLVVLFVAMQMAFNPYILFIALSRIVAGVSLAWFVPMVWPSVALMSLLGMDMVKAAAFAVLSLVFTVAIFEAAAWLRVRYWSPVPITIKVTTSTVYVPHDRSLLWLNPVGFNIASKELKSLVRRKDMARFLAIPVLLVVAFLLPTATRIGGSAPLLPSLSLFLAGEISFFLPIMLSSISIGQEGRSVVNLYVLPISASDLMKGKLFLAWTISAITVVVTMILFQALTPVAWAQFLISVVAALFIVLINGYVGLGLGSRYPDFTVGPRARYLTFTGFLLAFLIGGVSTLATYAPLAVYLTTDAFALLGMTPTWTAAVVLLFTAVIGIVILSAALRFCKKGVEILLSTILT